MPAGPERGLPIHRNISMLPNQTLRRSERSPG
jgi:hypothetical protein